MGRLIDIDVLFDYFGNDAIDETTRSNIEYFVSEKGTVEAIPKVDYENRLKADFAAMLDEIDLELAEQQADFIGADDLNESYGVQVSRNVIREKINALKGGE